MTIYFVLFICFPPFFETYLFSSLHVGNLFLDIVGWWIHTHCSKHRKSRASGGKWLHNIITWEDLFSFLKNSMQKQIIKVFLFQFVHITRFQKVKDKLQRIFIMVNKFKFYFAYKGSETRQVLRLCK